MDLKELRLGNLVLDKLYGGVVIITKYFFTEGNVNNIEPIQLTEEILLKCGFKKLGSVFCISERCVVDTSENRISFYIDRIEEDIDLDLPKHLHQLQNLYFALTGEELNILFN